MHSAFTMQYVIGWQFFKLETIEQVLCWLLTIRVVWSNGLILWDWWFWSDCYWCTLQLFELHFVRKFILYFLICIISVCWFVRDLSFCSSLWFTSRRCILANSHFSFECCFNSLCFLICWNKASFVNIILPYMPWKNHRLTT